tara:strand:- start:81 stop:878 length:798 start_codon:yes stop_codon:yes gene_type:complete
MQILVTIIIFTLGLSVGSFLNVVVYRYPNGKSLLFPNSFCPKCEKPILWFDNIPVLSFLFLQGKCRNCKVNISLQYPLTEIFFALLGTLFFILNKPSFKEIIDFLLFTSFLYIISLIDFKTFKIPNKINLYFYITGIIISVIGFFLNNIQLDKFIIDIFFAPLIIYIFFEILRSIIRFILKKEGFGGGDSKLIAALTVWLGLNGTLISIVMSFYLAGVFVLPGMLIGKIKKNNKIAFGPFLSASAFLVNLFGTEKFTSIIEKIYF